MFEPAPRFKRPRSDDHDDDDVSIVSRTPSPTPMDVDGDVHKYDEYVRGVPHEVITVETRIKPTNKGFAMLEKLGWTEGQSLGISGDGRTDPIPFQIKSDLTGLGKISQDVRMIETTVSQRRGLDSERQQKETEDQRRAREETVARKSALEDELSSTLKAFYCTLCDKQFRNVAQYDEHTNSYAHHHKARFKDMQANVRLKPKDEIDKRREKEKKREEKELRKIAAANGIKMAKPTTAAPLVPKDSPPTATTAHEVEHPPPPKRGGWATVSGSAPLQSVARSGWTSISSSQAPSSQSSPITPQPSASPNNPTTKATSNPTFRAAGWTSLEYANYEVVPPPPTNPASLTPLAPRGCSSMPPSESLPAEWSRPVTQPLTTPSSVLPSNLAPIASPSPEPIQQARWQQFQKSNHRRR